MPLAADTQELSLLSLVGSAQSGPDTRPDGRTFAERHLVRNFSLGITDGAFFGLYLVLADVNLVMPWLLSQLTTSSWIIGLPPILTMAGSSLPQIIAAHFVQRRAYRQNVVVVSTAARLALMALMLPFLFFSLGGPEITLVGVLVPYALSCLVLSFSALPWQDMTGKTIPGRRLSSFFGARGFLGGLLGLGASQFIGPYLGAVQTVPLPRFGVVLGLAVLAMCVTMLMNASIREPASPIPATQRPLGDHIAEAVRVSYRDVTFRYFLLARALLMLSAFTVPFFIVEGKTRYGLLAESVGTYTFAGIAAGIAASLVWSLVGDRLGVARLLRLVGVLSALPALLALAMPAIAASSVGALDGWLLVFVIQGAASAGQLNVNQRGLIQLAQPEHRALMIGAGSTFCGLVSLGGPLIGVLADAAGASAAFALAATLTLIVTAFAGLLRPRAGDRTATATV
jgi:hypothetical protein